MNEFCKKDIPEQVDNKPTFFWTKELVAEFSRLVAISYKEAECWSSDLSVEESMVDDFIKGKKYTEIYKRLILSETEESLIVDRGVFNELVNFLYIYHKEN